MKNISDTYRKYLLKITFDRNDYFTVWGSNNEDEDFILLDNKNAILLFEKISRLKEFILNSEIIIDQENFKIWATKISEIDTSTVYNLDNYKGILTSHNHIVKFKKETIEDILNFIILMEDYAYQINLDELIELFNNKSIELFKDYYYDLFFWKTTANMKQETINIIREQFNLETFAMLINKLVAIFIDNTQLIE